MRSLLFVASFAFVMVTNAQELGYRDEAGKFFITRLYQNTMLSDLVDEVTPKEYQVLYSDEVDLTKRVTTVSVMAWKHLIAAVFEGTGYASVELSPHSIYVYGLPNVPYILGLSPRNDRKQGQAILIRPALFLKSLDELARLYDYQMIAGPTLKAEPFRFEEAFFLKGQGAKRDLLTLESYAKTINDRVTLTIDDEQKIIYASVSYGRQRQLSLN